MDVILSRVGLNSDQQRALCLGAIDDEVVKTEAKLQDALVALKQLRNVVRVARDVHKSSASLAMQKPHTETSVARMTKWGRQISSLTDRIYSDLRSSSGSSSYEAVGTSTEEEEEEQVDWTVANHRPEGPIPVATPFSTRHNFFRPVPVSEAATPPGAWRNPVQGPSTTDEVVVSPGGSVRLLSHLGSAAVPRKFGPRVHIGQKRRANTFSPTENSFLRPSEAEQLSDSRPIKSDTWDAGTPKTEGRRDSKRAATHSTSSSSKSKEPHVVTDLKRRLSQIPQEEHEGALFKSIQFALEIAQLNMITGEEVRVQKAVNYARAAMEELLKRDEGFTIERNQHVEDVLQVLSVVVRAVLATKGKLEASDVRDMHDLIKQVQNKFEDSSTRFQWCNTNMRKFITAHYKKLASVSIEDQNKLVAALGEVREWKCSDDYSVSRFEGIMAVVRELLDGSYEEWQPCEDSRLAELLGLMNIRMGAFRDSAVQRTRQQEVNEWLSKMSGASFAPTLDLVSVPPPKTEHICIKSNGGFQWSSDVEESLKRIDQASRMPSLGYFIRTLYSFLTNAAVTKDQELLPLQRLREFNEHLQAVNSFDCELDHLEILRSSQELEKMLYLMRVIMHEHPDYEKCSISAVGALLAFFPPSKRPKFEFPSSVPPSDSQTDVPSKSVEESSTTK